MKDLIKADLFRIKKSKLALISLILAAAFPLLTASLSYGVEKLALLGMEELSGMEDLSGFDFFSSSSLLISAFSLSNNVGLLVPIFSCIFVGMDISSGTLRNKIMVGKNRSLIYLSHLFSSMIYNVLIISVYFLFTVIFAGLFFGFDEYAPLSFVYFIITGILTFAYVACLSTLLIMSTKSVAPSIILTEVITIGTSMLTALFSLVNYEKYRYLLYLIPTFTNSIGILTYSEAPTVMFLMGIASYLLFGTALTVFGIYLFKKKDIK